MLQCVIAGRSVENTTFTMCPVPLAAIYSSCIFCNHRETISGVALNESMQSLEEGGLFTERMWSGDECPVHTDVSALMLPGVSPRGFGGRASLGGQSCWPACPRLWFAFTGIGSLLRRNRPGRYRE